MQAQQIREHLRRQPFVPFRIYMSDGSQLDIAHPEFAVVTSREIAIAIMERSNGELPERMVYCDPLHVTHIEPLPGPREKSKRRRNKPE